MDPGAVVQLKALSQSLRELTFQFSNALVNPGKPTADEVKVKQLAPQMEKHIYQINQLLK